MFSPFQAPLHFVVPLQLAVPSASSPIHTAQSITASSPYFWPIGRPLPPKGAEVPNRTKRGKEKTSWASPFLSRLPDQPRNVSKQPHAPTTMQPLLLCLPHQHGLCPFKVWVKVSSSSFKVPLVSCLVTTMRKVSNTPGNPLPKSQDLPNGHPGLWNKLGISLFWELDR